MQEPVEAVPQASIPSLPLHPSRRSPPQEINHWFVLCGRQVTKTEWGLIKTVLNNEHGAGIEGFGYLVCL
jgi:hypothetical protein